MDLIGFYILQNTVYLIILCQVRKCTQRLFTQWIMMLISIKVWCVHDV